MMTSWNGNIFRVTGHLCGELTGPGEFPAQRPMTRSFDVFFDLRMNKRLSKQSWGWWFETLSRPLWRHRNGKKAWLLIGCWLCYQPIWNQVGKFLATINFSLGISQWSGSQVNQIMYEILSKYHLIQRSFGEDTWWRRRMETFSALLALCEENPLVTSAFPSFFRSMSWSSLKMKCSYIYDVVKKLCTKNVRWRLKSPASRLFTQPFIQVQIKKKSKLRVTDPCAGNSLLTGEFPAQMASNAENISIWWRHHELGMSPLSATEMVWPWTADNTPKRVFPYGVLQRTMSCIKSITNFLSPSIRKQGRPRKAWSECVKIDVNQWGQAGFDPQDREACITMMSLWARWRLKLPAHDCLLNRLFRSRSKITSKPRVTGLCVGNSPVNGEFPVQMASNTENVSIWWRYHVGPSLSATEMVWPWTADHVLHQIKKHGLIVWRLMPISVARLDLTHR